MESENKASEAYRWGFEGRVNFKLFPQVYVRYMPWMQNYFDRLIYYNAITVMALQKYQIGNLKASTNLNYYSQKSEDHFIDSEFGIFQTQTMGIQQVFTRNKKFSISGSYSYNILNSGGSSSIVQSCGIGSDFLRTRIFSISASGLYNWKKSAGDFTIYGQCQAIISPHISIMLRGEKRSNVRTNIIDDDYQNGLLKYNAELTLNYRW